MTNVHQLFARRETYSPDTLQVLGKAFDRAWQSVAGNFGDAPAEVHAARTTLANIILSLPCSETDDAERIKNAALAIMAVGYRGPVDRLRNGRASAVRSRVPFRALVGRSSSRNLT